jgi:DNA-binding protein H-NS
MAKINLSTLSSTELQILRTEIDSEIGRRHNRHLAIEEIKRLAQEKGLKTEDLIVELGGGKSRQRKEMGPIAARFRNPENHAQTWTGRGKRPLWVINLIESGKTLDNLKI